MTSLGPFWDNTEYNLPYSVKRPQIKIRISEINEQGRCNWEKSSLFFSCGENNCIMGSFYEPPAGFPWLKVGETSRSLYRGLPSREARSNHVL